MRSRASSTSPSERIGRDRGAKRVCRAARPATADATRRSSASAADRGSERLHSRLHRRAQLRHKLHIVRTRRLQRRRTLGQLEGLPFGRVAKSRRGSDRRGRESDRESRLCAAFARAPRVHGFRPRRCWCDDMTQAPGGSADLFADCRSWPAPCAAPRADRRRRTRRARQRVAPRWAHAAKRISHAGVR